MVLVLPTVCFTRLFNKLGFDFFTLYIAEDNFNIDKDLKEKKEMFYSDYFNYYSKLLLLENGIKDVKNFLPEIISIIYNILRRKKKVFCGADKSMLYTRSSLYIYPCQMYYQSKEKRLGNSKYIKEFRECIAKECCTSWCSGGSFMNFNVEDHIIPTRCIREKILLEKTLDFIVQAKVTKNQFFIKNLNFLTNKYGKIM